MSFFLIILITPSFNCSLTVYYHVRKVSDLFCENLVNFKDTCFHDATLNLHTHTWIFTSISTESVDGKHHLSEVVFTDLVGFSQSGKWRNDWSSALDSEFFWPYLLILGEQGAWWTTGVWFFAKQKKDESSALLQSFHHFPHNENPTRALNTTSLKCCLPSTDAIDRREKICVFIWWIIIALCKRTSLKSTRFSQTKSGWYLLNIFVVANSPCRSVYTC